MGEGLSPKYRLYAPCFILVFYRFILAAISLGYCGDYHHYALYVDDMASINLGEVVSLNTWATNVVSSIAALLT